MNIKPIFTTLLVVLALGFTSCSNEEEPSANVQEAAQLLPEEYLNILYEGKTYANVPTAYDENGDFVFLDEEFSAVYDAELKDVSTLSIHLVDDESIEMYKSLDDNLQAHCLSMSCVPTDSEVLSRTVVSPEQNYIGMAVLYDDKKFKDTHWEFGLLAATNPVWIPNLKSPYKFNDKCSSMILTNNLPNDPNKVLDMGSYTLKYSEATLVFIGYENSGYDKSTYTALANPSVKKEYRELKSFNDKMSSFQLFFAKSGIYEKEGFSK